MRGIGGALRFIVMSLALSLASISAACAQSTPAGQSAPSPLPAPAATPLEAPAPVPPVDTGKSANAPADHPSGYGLGFAMLAVIVILILLDKKFPILRDMPPPGSTQPPNMRPYSLGRFQMMVWTSVIATSAVYLYVLNWRSLTSPLEVISGSAAILIGISGGSGLIANVIDSSKDANQVALQQAADAKKAEAAASPPAAAAAAAKLQSDADSLKEQAEIQKRSDTKSSNCLTDMLLDDNGNSLHRIQMLAFTGILAVIFWWEVVQLGKMPTYSETTLGLMGISGGLYVGFKLPDPKVKP